MNDKMIERPPFHTELDGVPTIADILQFEPAVKSRTKLSLHTDHHSNTMAADGT